MKILDRYILRELIVPFLIGTLAVVMMFQANTLIFQLKTFSPQNTPAVAIVQWILYKTPSFLNMTLPVGMALAASLALSRLARESELTAMRSAGAPILRVVLPVALFGLIIGVGDYFLVEKVMPPAEKKFVDLSVKIGVLGAIPDFYSNAIVRLERFTVSIGTISKQPDGSIDLRDIIVVERPQPGVTYFTTADKGSYRDGLWKIGPGFFWGFNGYEAVSIKISKGMTINQKIVIQDLMMPPQPEEQTRDELLQAIATAKKIGSNTNSLEVEYYVRYAVPASCIVFAIVAPVFAILFARNGGFVGVLLSIVLVFLYYNAFIISTQILGRNGLVSPWLAAWLPNILFALLGVLGLRRLE